MTEYQKRHGGEIIFAGKIRRQRQIPFLQYLQTGRHYQNIPRDNSDREPDREISIKNKLDDQRYRQNFVGDWIQRYPQSGDLLHSPRQKSIEKIGSRGQSQQRDGKNYPAFGIKRNGIYNERDQNYSQYREQVRNQENVPQIYFIFFAHRFPRRRPALN
jgi:hypothetical protein